jgi:hypothetical protein
VLDRRIQLPCERALVALALLRATGRPVRVLGIPDVAAIGPLLRRFGGAVDHPAELRALLHAGELVLARRRPEVDAPVFSLRARHLPLGRRVRVAVAAA